MKRNFCETCLTYEDRSIISWWLADRAS